MNRLRQLLPILLLLSSAVAQEDGTLVTIAGGGTEAGDNVPAIDLQLRQPLDLDVDLDGNIYVADTQNQVIRRIDRQSGIATIVAGIVGKEGFFGDGGPATEAQLSRPGAVSVTTAGILYIGDTGNRRIRRVDPGTGIITTVAGTGEWGRFPDFVTEIPTSEVMFGEIVSLLAGPGIIWVGDGLDANGNGNNQILQILLDANTIGVIAGTGLPEYSGEGGSPVDAGMTVEGMAVDGSDGSLLFADFQAHRIRAIARVDSVTTTVTTVAGRGPAGIFGEGGFFGDGGPATQGQLNFPTGVAISGDGTIYIADLTNGRIRAVDPDGNMVTVAGNGAFGSDGDGDLAVRASFRVPTRVALDFDDNLLILDSSSEHSVIRRVSNPGFRFPLLESNRTEIAFAPSSLGVGSALSLLIANAGNATLDLTEFDFDNPLFSLDEDLPISVGPNLQRAISIRFDPIAKNPVSGTLTIRSNDLFQPVLVLSLSGSGIVPDIDVLPSELIFDPTFTDQTRQLRLRISNLARGQLLLEGITLSDTTNFSFFLSTENNFIGSGQSEDLSVRFHPTVAGEITASLSIFTNDPDEGEFIVPLSGIGIIPKPGGFANLAGSVGVADPGASFGVAWADYDADGDPDIYVVRSLQENRLYRNDGGTFTEVASALGVNDAGDGSGAAWADYDGDGDLDLYVTNFGQPNRLYRNEATFFTEVGVAAGVDDPGDGFGAAWSDTDRDGYPDLYVANFGPNVFYHNLGNGTFEEIANQLGIADSSSGIQPVFADFDNDRDPDLFLANSGPNRFWRNNGDGTFEDASFAFVPPDNGVSTGAAVGDFDNDGFLDLYIPYFGKNRLYQNQDGEGFADVGLSLGVADPGNGRGAVWGDFDNDGFLDLFVTNRDSENLIYRNPDGNSPFIEVGETFGVNTVADSRGVALADFDGDGGLDMFVAIQNDADQLFWNQEAEGNWLVVTPRGTTSSSDAIGTRIEIIYNRTDRAMREITGGTSFLSQDALSASFGIGEAQTVDTLNVRWPSGIFQSFSWEDIGVNRILTIVEADPLPPVEVQVVTTVNILVANGSAQTDLTVTVLNQEGEISLISGPSIEFILEIGGGTLDVSGPTIVDGTASARFTVGTIPGTISIAIIVAGLPSERVLLELIPPLTGNDTFIERIAGSGSGGFSGDGGLATDAQMNAPRSVAADSAGNVYVADSGNNRIRRISEADSIITTIAGSGDSGAGNIVEGPALDADIADPRGIFVHPDGDLILSEAGGQRVRRINLSTGITSAFAGSGFVGFSGDGGPATDANFTTPRGMTVDGQGRTYIADLFNSAVRLIEEGAITTIAGDPLGFFSFSDGVPATKSRLSLPNGVAVDTDGNLYIVESGGHRIRKVNPSGLISTFAGNGSPGAAGDGGPTTFSQLNLPQDIVYDPRGRLYVSDSGNNRIRSIDLATGIIQTIAGSGRSGNSGNQGDALNFSLNEPGGLALAPDSSILIADARNNRVLRLKVRFQDAETPTNLPPIDPGGGDGTADFNGDGTVDFRDFLPFAAAFGTSNTAFDLNGDGTVGFADFLLFSNAFGMPTSSNPAFTAKSPRSARIQR